MDETFVKTTNRLFNGQQLPTEMGRIQSTIRSRVAAVDGETLLETDADAWAEGMAAEFHLEPPTVDLDAARLHPGGRVDVDCTNAAGITFGATEFGSVIREGYELEVQIPVTGDAYLLATQALGAPPIPGGIRGQTIVCEWNWPDVKGGTAFDAEVATYKNELRTGTEVISRAVEDANAGIPRFVAKEIEARRNSILAQRDFLGALSIPVVIDDEEPRKFAAPPPVEPRVTPARDIELAGPEPPEREIGPQLDEFYDDILRIIRAVGRGIERSPGTFAEAGENALRDHMLVTLNTHYRGATYAEAFNGAGKTDILIRVYDRNAFIGECKWWSGAKAMGEAFDQLVGYTTWQDSRVALIFYVPTQDMSATIETAKSTLAERDEFIDWIEPASELEARCRIRWPEDPERVATLAAVFVHLPQS
jgi:hypothetical protein